MSGVQEEVSSTEGSMSTGGGIEAVIPSLTALLLHVAIATAATYPFAFKGFDTS